MADGTAHYAERVGDTQQYLTRGRAPIFVPLMRFLQQSLVSRSFLFSLRYPFVLFFLSSLVVWWNPLPIWWKSDLTNKMKRSFFQAAVVSILLYEGTTWTLTKRMEKKLDGNYTRMLRAILNKSWRQHPHKAPTVRPPNFHHENYQS